MTNKIAKKKKNKIAVISIDVDCDALKGACCHLQGVSLQNAKDTRCLSVQIASKLRDSSQEHVVTCLNLLRDAQSKIYYSKTQSNSASNSTAQDAVMRGM